YLEGGVQAVSAAPTPEPPPADPPDGAERVDLSRLRARIGENMIRSRQTAAHVWTSVEVDFEPIAEVRTAHKARFRREEGFSLTYLPFVCRAVIDALRAHPVVNSSFYLEDRQAVYHSRIDMGIAVDLDQQGLVVVTIRDADTLRLVGLARRIRHLATAARTRRLGPDQMTGSTFTITNPGPFNSFLSAPIINIPNVAILSTDTVAKRPVVVTTADGRDALAIRHIGYLGLSWDHRAFDGSTAMLFLQRIKNNLETWDWEQELK
ncbi:MAG: 2-oxo acid dehydrogenase subunit E2, partial [Acidimicrobiia bacterium]|nr:2-oxo acid dehydrogenase subunit E2 [Acidimicrobiia bacterium]